MSTDQPPCGSWATQTGRSDWMARETRGLVVTPTAGETGYVDCEATSLTSFGANGVIVHVPMVTLNQAYTSLIVETYTSFTDASYNASTVLFAAGDFVGFADQDACSGTGTCIYFKSSTYVASDMQWWRMIPADQGATLASQVSADGVQWADYGQRSLAGPGAASFISVTVSAGNAPTSTNPSSPPGMAVYASVTDCPN